MWTTNELAALIEESVDGIKVISPAEAEKQISQFSLIFNAILLGIAFIALVVGGLSIINTMIMSVSERTKGDRPEESHRRGDPLRCSASTCWSRR